MKEKLKEKKRPGNLRVDASAVGQVIVEVVHPGVICFTPDQARNFAAALLDKATVAEAYQRKWA